MSSAFPGLGTVINVAAILVGGTVGMFVGHRLPDRTRGVVTDCLGLVTLLMAALSAYQVVSPALSEFVGSSAPILVVLGGLLVGSIAGSLLGIEVRLERLAGRVQAFVADRRGHTERESSGEIRSERERFIEGWMTASLLFCVGPLAILGSLNDGLGRGIDELALKSVLDGFAAMAFASTFGLGVLLSAVSVAVVQGLLTVAGVFLGGVLPEAHLAALTAVGGLLLVGISLRLLRIREVPVGDMLPALITTPLLTAVVGAFVS